MMSATHKERPILGCSSRRTSGSKTRKASQSFKVLYFKNIWVKIPLIKAHLNLWGVFSTSTCSFFWEHPSTLYSSIEILKLKVLTICQCGTSDRRRQENIGSRVGCKYFQQQFRTPEKNGQYSCKHLLAFFFQEPFIPWQQAMAALVGFSSMEQVVPIIHKDNIYKHTLGFIWRRFVFFLHLEGVFPSSSLFIQCFGRSESSMQKWMFRGELIFNYLWLFFDTNVHHSGTVQWRLKKFGQ